MISCIYMYLSAVKKILVATFVFLLNMHEVFSPDGYDVCFMSFASDDPTNVQCWPQDPYFPFSSLVPHFSEVWKCGKV